MFSWDEQRLVVHSFKYAATQKRILKARTEKPQEAHSQAKSTRPGQKTPG